MCFLGDRTNVGKTFSTEVRKTKERMIVYIRKDTTGGVFFLTFQ